MIFNIVCKNEIKLIARSKRMFIIMAIYNIILAVIAMLVLFYVRNITLSSGLSPYRYMMPLNIGLMSITAVLLALFITPAAGGSVAGERERQTLDILLSSRLTPAQIVTGKMMSSACSAFILLISGVPVITVTLVYGGIGLAEIYQSVLYVAFFVLLIAAVGVFCSCTFKTTTSANVASYGIILFLTLGTAILVVLSAFAVNAVSPDNSSYYVGPMILFWLLNPAVTFTGLTFRQLNYTWFNYMLATFGVPDVIISFWSILSIILQTVFICIMILFSIRNLDPLREGLKHKKKTVSRT